MRYQDFHGIRLSALGLGCMRLPTQDKYENIDIPAVKEMVAFAMDNGINYFDTAWGYHGGHSEPVMGEVLADYPRDSFYLATKFPGFNTENMERVEEIFEEQLRRCRVDYFDFYLFHCVSESNIDGYLDPAYGIYDYLMQQKQNGRIRHLGFSVHATLETTRRFLDAYGDGIEFCQVQLNWLDYEFQDAKAKLELLAERHIPVWVMEPLRGGSLCNLNACYTDRLAALRPDVTPVEWAFRFLQTIPTVTVTLSGMSNMEQLSQNVDYFATSAPLNKKEWDTLLEIGQEMTAKKTLACTACRYCTDRCPQELNIPEIIKKYNEHLYSGHPYEAGQDSLNPAACLGCGACEAVCPQQIRITEMMAELTEALA